MKDTLIEDGKFHEIYEGNYYATSKHWVAGMDDDSMVQLALYLEIMDMFEATGEKEFESWPLVLEMSIVVARPGPKWLEQALSAGGTGADEVSEETALEESYRYGGGIPVTHILRDITGGGSDIDRFSGRKVHWVTDRPTHGTVAAQRGSGTKFEYPMFREKDVALEFANELLKRAPALFGMVGFFLDLPINMAGDDGWSVIVDQSQ